MPNILLPSKKSLVKPARFVLNKDSPQAVGLVAWFPFGSGLNAVDGGPVGRYNLDPVNGPTFTFDKERGRVADLLTSSSQRFNAALTPVTSHPCTICCWHNKDNTTDVAFIIDIYNSADAAQFMGLMARSSGEIRGRKDGQTGSPVNADIASGYSAGVWQFAGVVFAASNSMTAYANKLTPVAQTTDTGTIVVDGICIGAEMFTTPRSYYGGLVDDVRIYNRALTQDEMFGIQEPNNQFDLYYEIGRRSFFFMDSGSAPITPGSAVMTFAADIPVVQLKPPSAVMTFAADTPVVHLVATSAVLTFAADTPVIQLRPPSAVLTWAADNASIALGITPPSAVLTFAADIPVVQLKPPSAVLTWGADSPTIQLRPLSGVLTFSADIPVVQLRPPSAVLTWAADNPTIPGVLNPASAVLTFAADTPVIQLRPNSAPLTWGADNPTIQFGLNPASAVLLFAADIPTVQLRPPSAILTWLADNPSMTTFISKGGDPIKLPGSSRVIEIPADDRTISIEGV